MRVGLIIYGSINATTGGYIYDDKLVEYLRAQGVVVKIFSQEKKGFWGCVKNNYSSKIFREIIEFSPHILLQDEMNFSSLFILNKKLQKITHIPIISIVHLLQADALQTFFLKWMTKKIESKYLKSVHGYIFNSLSTKKSITNMIGEKNLSVVAYPGKDRLQLNVMKEYISFKCQDNKLMIIFIGNLLYNKGLHLLIEALGEIDFKMWQLSIVGGLHYDSKYTQKILKRITDLKLGDNIKILGALDIENLKKELLPQHVLIVPSYFESYGIVYTEAMGAGIPVIASKTGGVPEIVNNEINGFLISPGDTTMLRDYILKLIENRDLLKKMSFSSLSAYQNFPSWNDSMAKVYEFLRKIKNAQPLPCLQERFPPTRE
ncbi:CapM protein, capsular polysaccharide biosynthesis [Legionella wadsworthii]|uniref:CapM protein, capsular polysaccharide biosynthesis n=1 Tax=Legionella wadsworthii TaxID=28088 RepID=A0A378LRH9_9GAMM|nr:glycosyltransferase family 4 protein [Legionella wadsworthii]STY28448.1 CapM protein, capsular polysaccharide biosynthesis [Legionella wadsworthii]